MARKKNCWEFLMCGREQGGIHEQEFGVCPVTFAKRLDGEHGGVNGGRTCWVVAGTLCGGEAQGSFVDKYGTCMQCDFYRLVLEEEGIDFKVPSFLLATSNK